jgi:hypothetical protein
MSRRGGIAIPLAALIISFGVVLAFGLTIGRSAARNGNPAPDPTQSITPKKPAVPDPTQSIDPGKATATIEIGSPSGFTDAVAVNLRIFFQNGRLCVVLDRRWVVTDPVWALTGDGSYCRPVTDVANTGPVRITAGQR